MELIGRILTVSLALGAAFAAALWVAAVVWAYHDIRARTQDIYVRMFGPLIVLLFGPLGAVLYLVMRPRETLDDGYLRALQEEAILREMETGTAGPSMGLHTINGKSPTLGRNVFVAPGAQLIGDVRLGDDVSVWYNAVLRADIAPVIVGAGSNIQDGCVLHVDPDKPLLIGANVTLGHMAMVHACTIEDECLIGIQATVLSGAHIRKHSIVGAAALVTEGREAPERSMLLGVPAKVAREITDREVSELIVERAAEYRKFAADALRQRSDGALTGRADGAQQTEARRQPAER
jgi:carbonic anhydrase/acetyltransferase-like protein (isoleucine patch superfamily)